MYREQDGEYVLNTYVRVQRANRKAWYAQTFHAHRDSSELHWISCLLTGTPGCNSKSETLKAYEIENGDFKVAINSLCKQDF